MSLRDTILQMRALLVQVCTDLNKAAMGNKAAAQRVRTGTIRLEKVAKHFRKESVAAFKAMKKGKKKSAAKKPAPAKKPAAKKHKKAKSSSKKK